MHTSEIWQSYYDTEKITMDFFSEFFAENMSDIEVIKSVANKRIFKVYA